MSIFKTDKANEDLLRIYLYLAERNQAAAEVLMREFDSRFLNLSRFPFIGRERNGLLPGLRSIVIGSYLIFYVVEPSRIVIVRIPDLRMDVDEQFRR